jgi:arsenate reductase
VTEDRPIRVLFVSTGDASRGILAEAVLRRAGGDRFVVASAGVAPAPIEPATLRVLDDAGFDHEWAVPEPVSAYIGRPFDYVITLCDDARATCPTFDGADQSIHWGYRDPSRTEGDDATRLRAYQRVLTDLGQRVRQFVVIAERQDRLASA